MKQYLKTKLYQMETDYNPDYDLGDPEVTYSDKVLLDAVFDLSNAIDEIKDFLEINDSGIEWVRMDAKQVQGMTSERNELVNLLQDVLGDFPHSEKSNAVEAARDYLKKLRAS